MSLAEVVGDLEIKVMKGDLAHAGPATGKGIGYLSLRRMNLMNRDDFAMLCVELDRRTIAYDGILDQRCYAPPSVIVDRAKRIARHAKRLRGLTDERAIQRILFKIEVITGVAWEAETTDGITYLVGPFFIPHD